MRKKNILDTLFVVLHLLLKYFIYAHDVETKDNAYIEATLFVIYNIFFILPFLSFKNITLKRFSLFNRTFSKESLCYVFFTTHDVVYFLLEM